MKFVKMSLAAVMLMGTTSAFAFENVKFDGGAGIFYDTSASTVAEQAESLGEAYANLGVTADLAEGLKGGVRLYMVDTLGLESNVVGGTWTGVMTAPNFSGEAWASELWLAKTIGNTTVKVGRQDLDTPLAFTETWNAAPNTFDAAVVLNSDIPDTTLVAAYVGKHNGGGATVAAGASFTSFYNDAYAVGVINNSFKPLTAQAWYYNLDNVVAAAGVDAYWLQADFAMNGIVAGAQYADLSLDGGADSKAYAVKVGYDGIENLSMFVAYSKTDDEAGALTVANTATGAQSKLYTEAWWNFGVGVVDTEAYNFTAEYSMPDVADFGIYAVTMDQGLAGDMDEVTVTAAKNLAGVDLTLAYIYADRHTVGAGTDQERLQAYISVAF